ncbi:MAG: TPM domain-containing protein [Actinomycetales bacterium]|nr:TPM domain-containing protein [Actinomycetales bacterium]
MRRARRHPARPGTNPFARAAAVAALAGAGLLAVAPASAALASSAAPTAPAAPPVAAPTAPLEDPFDIGGAYLADESGVLGSDAARVQGALDRLYADHAVALYVVLVPAFTGAPSDTAWADQTANLSSLGDADNLLAIATDADARSYATSFGPAAPVTDAQIEQASAAFVAAMRGSDDYASGILAFVDSLNGALAPSPVPWVVGGVALVGVGGIATAVVVSNRRRKRAQADSDEALATKAGSALVALDDQLKTSREELGFAEAQFGEKLTQDFRAALESAQAQAKQAFELQQKLDDAVPETPEQRRTMLQQVIELATAADATLDAQADAFDELRKIEQNAPALIDELATAQAALAATIAAGEKELAGLQTRFSAKDLDAVDDAPDQARARADFAAESLDKARAAVTGGDSAAAAVAVRGAQQAIAQAQQLVASIGALGAELDARAKRKAKAATALQAAISDARASIAATNDYISARRGGIGATARTRVAEAERHLATATSLASSDPEKALAEANQARDLAASALESARSDVEQAQRELARANSSTGYGGAIVGGRSGGDGSFMGGVLGGLIGSSSGGSPRGGFGGSSRSGGLFGGGSSRSSWGSSSRSGGSIRRASSGGSRSGGRRGGSGRF